MLKDIAVIAQAGIGRAPQIAAAARLAKAQSAALAGICAVAVPPIPAYAEAPVGVELIQQELERRREAAQALGQSFLAEAGKAGVAAEWRVIEADPRAVALAHGRTADLVMLGQPEPDSGGETADVEELTLALGRPVLVVPYVGTPDAIGQRVLVAWNGSREAARATHDAMPFLKSAQSVVVVAADLPEAGQPGLDRLTAHLARHGVNAKVRRLASDGIGVGDLLLNAAADESADLIVMGAYGHSRMRELVLGGATRTLFRHMTIPVLFSH